MSWKTATSELTPTWQKPGEELKAGASVEGVLVERKSGLGKNANSNLYILEQKGGEKIGVWGSAIIDMRLADKAIGTLLRITFKGKERSKKTGNNVNLYDVEYDDSTVAADAADAFLREAKA
jgi:hypothetical protein